MSFGFKVVQERAIQFAKANAEAGFALASELAKADDLPMRPQAAIGRPMIQRRYNLLAKLAGFSRPTGLIAKTIPK